MQIGKRDGKPLVFGVRMKEINLSFTDLELSNCARLYKGVNKSLFFNTPLFFFQILGVRLCSYYYCCVPGASEKNKNKKQIIFGRHPTDTQAAVCHSHVEHQHVAHFSVPMPHIVYLIFSQKKINT